MTPEQKMAKQIALNKVRDAAQKAQEAQATAATAQAAYTQAARAALQHATGDEVAQAAGRSRGGIYRALRSIKR